MARSHTLAILIIASTISEVVSGDTDGFCTSDQCDSNGMTPGASKSGAVMLQVSRDSNGHRLATTNAYEWISVGKGQCTDDNDMFIDMGWAQCESGPGTCLTVQDCAKECAQDSQCAALGYYQEQTGGWCWLYKKMDTPYTRHNGEFDWYECLIKGAALPELTTAPATIAPTPSPPGSPQPEECDPQVGMTVPLQGGSPGAFHKQFTGVPSVTACMNKCKADDDCKAIIYNSENQGCFTLPRKYNENYKPSASSVVSNRC